MKWTLVSLIVVIAALMIVAVIQGDGALSRGLRTGGSQFAKFFPVLCAAFLIMGLTDALLPEEVVQRWLSDAAGWRGMAVGWLAGALTPAGSVAGMPIAAGLLKAGAGPAVLITYLTSLATLSIIRIPLEIGFYGWRLMALRVVTSLLLPFAAGLLARMIAPAILR